MTGFPRLCGLIVASQLVGIPALAGAPERPRPAVEVSAGWVAFADDGVVSETPIGGALRWYLTPRLGIGPEVLYIQGRHHSHLVATGNLTFDLIADVDRPRGITPFLVVGGGVFQTRETFPSGPFTSADGTFTVGGGLRARVSRRVSVGADARVGWELHLRIGGLFAIDLGP